MNLQKYFEDLGKVKTFLPRETHRNLKHHLSVFLMLYPMPTKKIKQYKKLTNPQKLSYVLKYFMGHLYKEKVDKALINFYKEVKDDVRWRKSRKKWKYEEYEKHEAKDRDGGFDPEGLKLACMLDVLQSDIITSTQNLTEITIALLIMLNGKRGFMIENVNVKRYL